MCVCVLHVGCVRMCVLCVRVRERACVCCESVVERAHAPVHARVQVVKGAEDGCQHLRDSLSPGVRRKREKHTLHTKSYERTQPHTNTHTHIHTYTHTYIHTHTHTQTYIHTYTHTATPASPCLWCIRVCHARAQNGACCGWRSGGGCSGERRRSQRGADLQGSEVA